MTSTIPQLSPGSKPPRIGEILPPLVAQRADLDPLEEELRMCIGIPPWFDTALSFLVAQIVQDFGDHKAPRESSARWIRAEARRASQRLERTLAEGHAKDGFVTFNVCESFQAVVCSALERQRSLYWEDIRCLTASSVRRVPLGGTE